MAQQVTVTLNGAKAEFRSHGPESDGFAEYLSKMFDQVNNPGPTQETLLAKARLGGTVLEANRLKHEKARVLKDQADQWLAKSRETNISVEIRDYLENRASAALKAAGELEAELG